MIETCLGMTIGFLLLLFCAIAARAEAPLQARAYPEGDRLFHADARWLGGDAAISVPLSAERTLWLFGDSFVDEVAPHSRSDSAFVRNTIAIETGNDPQTAMMRFVWRHDAQGRPSAFVAGGRRFWYWPRGGIRLNNGPLYLFLDKVKPASNELRFAVSGYAIARISNPDDDPARWNVRVLEQPALPFDALPGLAPILDGAYVTTLATRERGTHAGALVRYRLDGRSNKLETNGEWWLGVARGWVHVNRIGPSGPTFVIDDAGAESSIHWDARLRAYVHVASYGFGATTIGVRTAAKLTGPWSAARTVYRPPESDRPRPFVYAGKAHPELRGPGLLVTYVANSFDPNALLTPEGERDLYWPHFVVVPNEKLQ